LTGTRTGYDRFFPDDRSALSGHPGGSGSPKLRDVTTGNEIRSLPDTHETSVAFSPEGRIALSSGFGKTVALWDIAAGNKIPTFTGHAEYIPSVAFSPDGRAALSGSKDKTLKLWDIATGYNIRAPLPHSDLVTSVTFLPTCRRGPVGRVFGRRPNGAVRQRRRDSETLGPDRRLLSEPSSGVLRHRSSGCDSRIHVLSQGEKKLPSRGSHPSGDRLRHRGFG
jgi:WD40 repeat protein